MRVTIFTNPNLLQNLLPTILEKELLHVVTSVNLYDFWKYLIKINTFHVGVQKPNLL